MRRTFSVFAVFVITLLCLSNSGFAQVTTGSILGTVHDSTGAVIPGATVTITDTGKGTSQAYQTDTQGNYSAPYLLPGTYLNATYETITEQWFGTGA